MNRASADRGGEKNLPEIVLASTSPYRRDLLDRIGLPYRCVPPQCDEDAFKHALPGAHILAESLAFAKAASVQAAEPHAAIIGCDQIAACAGRIFGKPDGTAAAIAQLGAMVGQIHELHTALVVLHEDRVFRHTDVTRLRMRDLSPAAIKRYVAVDKPLDCAGSYKLESRGIALFDRIESKDNTAITGLPLIALVSILRNLGFEIP